MLLKRILFGLMVVLLFEQPLSGDPPQHDIHHVFEHVIEKFISKRGFPGAVVCIYQNGRMILNQAYGKDVDVNTIYPLASNSKIFTRHAIEKLIQKNLLSKEDLVWEYLDLSVEPKDPKVKEITIGHLLEHKGGWDRDSSPDPLFSGIAAPNTKTFVEKIIRSTPLDFIPGSKKCYSNFGYVLLGLVIEKITGLGYLEYINKTFAEPWGIEIYQAQTPKVYSRNTPFAGDFFLELVTSSLGLAARAQDMAKLVSQVQAREENWWLDGSLPGTITSLVRQRVNQVTIVVFIPDRDDNCWKDDNEDLRKAIDHAANKVGL